MSHDFRRPYFRKWICRCACKAGGRPCVKEKQGKLSDVSKDGPCNEYLKSSMFRTVSSVFSLGFSAGCGRLSAHDLNVMAQTFWPAS